MDKKLIDRYYVVTFISELARTIPHPILVIFLINQKGLTLSEITFIQIFFYIGVLLCEIPSGYLSDLGYRKSCYVASFISMLIAYSLIYTSSSIIVLAIAWFIYGIAGALTSGNVDGYIVNQLKDQNSQGEIKQFNVRKTNISLFASIGGALIGSILYPHILGNIYQISIGLYTLALVITIFGIEIKHQGGEINKVKIKDVQFSKQLKLLMAIICTVELYYVGFYQYWQVLYENKGIEPSYFGLIYIVFSVTVICSNRAYAKINEINDKLAIPIFLIAALISIIFLNSIVFCIIYPITLFIANLYVIDTYTKLYEAVDSKVTSSVISIVSSTSRIIGICILALLTYFLSVYELSQILVFEFSLFGIILVIVRRQYQKINKG